MNQIFTYSKSSKSVVINDSLRIGGKNRPVIMAGPCSVWDFNRLLDIAERIKDIGGTVLRGGAFKPRTKITDFQGLGLQALQFLGKVSDQTNLPVVTEVMDIKHIDAVAMHADILQIGSRNMYNYPLLREVGMCKKPILLKRGFSATIEEWIGAYEYIGHDKVIFCERGIRSFDHNTRNTLDLAAVPILQSRTALPVIVDPSHATGRRELIEPMSLAAIAAGADGLLIEASTQPDSEKTDSFQTISMETLQRIIQRVNLLCSIPLQ